MPQLDFDGANSRLSADNIRGQSGSTITIVSGHNLSGGGSGLTGLNATNLATGTVATARLGSGTANNTVFLRGDGTWAAAGGVDGITSSADATAISIDANEIVTMPKQPAFSASMPDTSNLAVGSFVKLNFNAEVFDQNADFNTSTNTFTAPVSGRYLFTMFVEAMEIDNQCTALRFDLNTSNDTLMEWSRTEPDVLNNADMSRFGACGSILANMDANDTAHVQVHITGGQAQMEVTASSRFEGVLIC